MNTAVDSPVDTAVSRSTVIVMADAPSSANPADPLARFGELAASRRSSLRVDPTRAVDDELLDRLVSIAATAPNHKRTFPWRFRILTGEGRAGLGSAFAADLQEENQSEAKIEKARTKYLRAPVVIAVASRAGDDQTMTDENRDAVSAAIQTLLLAATATGLASYWSTGGAMTSKRVKSFCRFDDSDTMVGLVYLGWPNDELPPLERPAPESLRIGPLPSNP